MNETDSERIVHIFHSNGFIEAQDPCDADVIIINSCSVREKAEQKLMSLIGRLIRIKDRNPGLRIGVCGCTVQKDPEGIINRFKGLDFIFGTFDIPDCFEIYLKSCKKPHYSVRKEPFHSLDKIRDYSRKMPHKAFVTIMEGCDNFCTYCIIPFVRGRERSRPRESIIREVEMLVERGTSEITLLGQNVNRYSCNGIDFAGLLDEVARVEGLKRLRFITSHPRDIDSNLFDVISRHENICKSFHLPFQSGSDRILKLMNRGYTHREYLCKIERLKEYVNNPIFTTDIIVGFPTETEEDFNDTLRMIEEVRFWGAFSFRYSVRYPSKASNYSDDVPMEKKLERLHLLQKRQNEITLEINRGFLKDIQTVLIDGTSKKSGDYLTGKNEFNINVNLRQKKNRKELPIGDFVQVFIEGYSNNSLIGYEL